MVDTGALGAGGCFRSASFGSSPGRRQSQCTGTGERNRTVHPTSGVPAAFALALLYVTVLAFDGVGVPALLGVREHDFEISMSFGKELGFLASVLGIFQNIGAALEMCAAISYTFVERRLGSMRAGLVGLLVGKTNESEDLAKGSI